MILLTQTRADSSLDSCQLYSQHTASLRAGGEEVTGTMSLLTVTAVTANTKTTLIHFFPTLTQSKHLRYLPNNLMEKDIWFKHFDRKGSLRFSTQELNMPFIYGLSRFVLLGGNDR